MKILKEILQIILAIILMAAGLGLIINFLNGLLIIGVMLVILGIVLLLYTAGVVIIKHES